MTEIQMTNDSAILVDASTSEDFIQSRIYFSKGNRTGCYQSFAIRSSSWSQFAKVDSNACTVSECMADETPTGFDSIFSFHSVFHNKHSAGNWKSGGWVVEPGVNPSCTGNQFFGGVRHFLNSGLLVQDKKCRL
jgi:hypothetical protein